MRVLAGRDPPSGPRPPQSRLRVARANSTRANDSRVALGAESVWVRWRSCGSPASPTSPSPSPRVKPSGLRLTTRRGPSLSPASPGPPSGRAVGDKPRPSVRLAARGAGEGNFRSRWGSATGLAYTAGRSPERQAEPARRFSAEGLGREAAYPARRGGSASRDTPTALQHNDFSAKEPGKLGPDAILSLRFPVR
jgi:hypothetical protein